eukprot:1192632-Prorocentrum_minimum.AAC.6
MANVFTITHLNALVGFTATVLWWPAHSNTTPPSAPWRKVTSSLSGIFPACQELAGQLSVTLTDLSSGLEGYSYSRQKHKASRRSM